MTKSKKLTRTELEKEYKDSRWIDWIVIIVIILLSISYFISQNRIDKLQSENEMLKDNICFEQEQEVVNYTLTYECFLPYLKKYYIKTDVFQTKGVYENAKKEIEQDKRCEVIK